MRGQRRARGLAAMALVGAALLAGCASTPGKAAVRRSGPAPDYARVAARYNERAAKLGRVWARAVFRVDYTDEEGRERREQLEGHLQFAQPARLALSGGKSITDTLFWLGCDATRFWFFELGETRRVTVGRHENIGLPCCETAGLPAQPLDVIALLGVTPLPATGGRTGWSTDGRWLVVEAPGRAGTIQLFLDSDSLEPAWVKLLRTPEGRADAGDMADAQVFGELTDYEPLTLRDAAPGAYPRIASHVSIQRPGSDDRIRLSLFAPSDGRDRSGRLAPEAFDFDALMKAFAPKRIAVLDASCPTPAYTPAFTPANGRREAGVDGGGGR